jgi:septal ring-binding cell division protein DamX
MFISGWMFFLGVVIGRGTAPAMFDYQKIETEIAALSKTFMENRKTQNDLDTDILTTQAELEYPEELKKKTEDPAKLLLPTPSPSPVPTISPASTQSAVSPVSEKPVKPADSPKPVHREPVQGAPPAPIKSDQNVAAKSESVESPPDTIRTLPEGKIRSMYDIKAQQTKESAQEKTAAAAPERTPVATPKSQPPAAAPKSQSQPTVADVRPSAAQPVTVQMPSLLDRKSADVVIENLRSKGISASKSPRMIQGKGVWYTVVIGKYASTAEADAVMNRLKQENVDAVKQ